MNHLAKIQGEFLKEARKWDDLTYEEQKLYLRKHPGSKRKVTARPRGKTTGLADVKQQIFKYVKRLDQLVEKYKTDGLTRTKIFWVIRKALRGDGPAPDPRAYNLTGYDQNKKQKIARRLFKIIRRLKITVNNLKDDNPKIGDATLNYVKSHFLLNREVKPVRDLEGAKPKETRVKKVKSLGYAKVGDRIRLNTKKGLRELTITAVRSMRSGNWLILGDTDNGEHWHMKRPGSSYANMRDVKFLGAADKEDVKRHVTNRHDFERTVQAEKDEARSSNRDKLSSLNVQRGSKIWIRGPGYNWPATVVEVDMKQGGVRIDQQRTRRQRGKGGLLGSLMGMPGGVTTHYRFIPARNIVKVN